MEAIVLNFKENVFSCSVEGKSTIVTVSNSVELKEAFDALAEFNSDLVAIQYDYEYHLDVPRIVITNETPSRKIIAIEDLDNTTATLLAALEVEINNQLIVE